MLLLAGMAGMSGPDLYAQKTRSVEKPDYACCNTRTLEIEKIDLMPDSTLLHFKAHYPPGHWIRIAPTSYIRAGADGPRMVVLSSNGIPLGAEYDMPASGEHTFTLTFPAVDPQTQKIDFIEGDSENDYKIYDIGLVKTKAGKSAFAKRYAKSKSCTAELTAPVVNCSPATLTGRIEGYSPRFFKTVNIEAYDVLLEDNRYKTDTEVRPDGTFSVQLPVIHPMRVRLLLDGGTCLMPYVEPGKETVLEIDPRGMMLGVRFAGFSDLERAGVTYYGELGRVNNDLYRMQDRMPSVRVGFPGLHPKEAADRISRLSPEQYKGIVMDSLRVARERIGAAKTLCPRARQVLLGTVWADAVCQLLSYELNIDIAHREKMERFDWNAPVPPIEEPDTSYYDFLKEYPVNDETMLVSSEGVSALSAICFYTAKKSPSTRKTGRGYSFELEDVLAEPATVDLVGSDKGIFYDLALFEKLSRIQQNDSDTPESYRDRFSNPAFWQEAVARNARKEALLAEKRRNPEFTVNEIVRAETPEATLQAIFDRYKGKVVFVDFWETWCLPCRMAMKEAEPVKDALKGRDVVYLYFASGRSPENTWQKMVPMIRGEHYRLPDDVFLYATERYRIAGVPSYLILDREGKQTHFQVGFMGADRMKEMLLEQLDK